MMDFSSRIYKDELYGIQMIFGEITFGLRKNITYGSYFRILTAFLSSDLTLRMTHYGNT
jgi:hypothetical protein